MAEPVRVFHRRPMVPGGATQRLAEGHAAVLWAGSKQLSHRDSGLIETTGTRRDQPIEGIRYFRQQLISE